MKFENLLIGDIFNTKTGRFCKIDQLRAVCIDSSIILVGSIKNIEQDLDVIPIYSPSGAEYDLPPKDLFDFLVSRGIPKFNDAYEWLVVGVEEFCKKYGLSNKYISLSNNKIQFDVGSYEVVLYLFKDYIMIDYCCNFELFEIKWSE